MKAALSTALLGGRQLDRRAQAGSGVLQTQHATMQIRHRLHQSEAQAGAGRASRGIATIETFGGAGKIFLRYSWTLVGDRDLNAVCFARRRQFDRAMLGREFDRVIDKIGDRLLDQRGVAIDLQSFRMRKCQIDAFFFGHGAVQIGDAFQRVHQIDAPE